MKWLKCPTPLVFTCEEHLIEIISELDQTSNWMKLIFFIMWQAPFCRRNYPQNGKMSSYRHHLAFACEKYHKKHLLNWIDHFLCEWSVFVFLKWQALKRNHLQNGLLSSWGRYLFHHLKKSFIEILCCINQGIAKQKKLQRGHLRIVMNHCITK